MNQHITPPENEEVRADANENTENPDQRGGRERAPDLNDSAIRFVEMFGQLTDKNRNPVAYCEEEETWVQWTGTYWRDVSRSKTTLDTLAVQALCDVGVPITNSGKVDGTIRLAKARMRREFTRRENLVNFANGTLEIVRVVNDRGTAEWQIGELRQHDMADGLRYCLPYDYDTSVDWPTVRRFLEESIPDPLARECDMALDGLALLGDTSLHACEIEHGPTRSGKGVRMQLSGLVVGVPFDKSAAFVGADLFDEGMEGKRVRYAQRNVAIACIDEVPAAAMHAEALFKIMTAHGGVAMRGIGRDEETENAWRPKIRMATNEVMALKDPSGAMAERIIPVHFPNHRPKGQRDLTLVEKMVPELPGFAVACIIAALDVKNRGYFKLSRAQQKTLELWGLLGNALRRFIAEKCIVGDQYRAPANRFYVRYETYVNASGGKPLSKANMTSELVAMALGVSEGRGRAEYREYGQVKPFNGTVLCGVALRDDADVEETSIDEVDYAKDMQDYRPAITTDADLMDQAFKLLDANDFDGAAKIIGGITDESDRNDMLQRVRNARHSSGWSQRVAAA